MITYESFLEEIHSGNIETMHENFMKYYNDNFHNQFKFIDGDLEHFVEKEDDDRRLVSEEVFLDTISNIYFKVTIEINNDRYNFTLIDFDISTVKPKTETKIVYN